MTVHVRQTAVAAPLAQVAAGAGGVNRREFLTYAWGAALALLAAESALATYDFTLPRFRAGEFGGQFDLGKAAALPSTGAPPQVNTKGKFWLVNTEAGVQALYVVCTHLGCLYRWSEGKHRFECPCHGSKFTANGDYIEGPAPRSLDQFVVEVVENGQVVAQTEDGATAILPPRAADPGADIRIQTGKKILGKPATTSPARAVSA